MTEEHVTLHSMIDKAVGEYCTQRGGGFPMAYVAIVEMSNAEGQQMIVVSAPLDQQIYRSMGLTQYANAWYLDDANRIWAPVPNVEDGD